MTPNTKLENYRVLKYFHLHRLTNERIVADVKSHKVCELGQLGLQSETIRVEC